jgi:hypothetical protein
MKLLIISFGMILRVGTGQQVSVGSTRYEKLESCAEPYGEVNSMDMA